MVCLHIRHDKSNVESIFTIFSYCKFASPLFISPSFYKLHCTPGRGRGSRPRKPPATFFEFSPFSLQTAWRGAFVDEIFCNMKLKFMLNFCLL